MLKLLGKWKFRRGVTDRELCSIYEKRAEKAKADFLILQQTYSGLLSSSTLLAVALYEARAEQCKCGGQAHG